MQFWIHLDTSLMIDLRDIRVEAGGPFRKLLLPTTWLCYLVDG